MASLEFQHADGLGAEADMVGRAEMDGRHAVDDRAFEEGWVRPEPAARRTGKKIAVVGSGPAGLACAQQLARAGHDVHVFEQWAKAGGLLRYGIPDFKMEKIHIDRRVEQMQGEGVVFHYNADVGVTVPVDKLYKQHDAIVLPGAGYSSVETLSPDGSTVYFAIVNSFTIGSQNYPAGLYSVPAAGGTPKLIVSQAAVNALPNLSASSVFVVPIAGGEGDDLDMGVSADGTRLVDEEQFGPVLPVIKYSDPEDALARANASPYGLGASVWSSNPERAQALAERMDAGTVWINKHSELAPNIPFGGAKESGIGAEMGEDSINEYTQLQVINAAR